MLSLVKEISSPFLGYPSAMWSSREYATWHCAKWDSPRSWPLPTWKIFRQSFTSGTGRRFPRSPGRIPSSNLVSVKSSMSFLSHHRTWSTMGEQQPLALGFYCLYPNCPLIPSPPRHIHPEDKEVIHWQQGTQEPGKHQHGTAGCTADHGG